MAAVNGEAAPTVILYLLNGLSDLAVLQKSVRGSALKFYLNPRPKLEGPQPSVRDALPSAVPMRSSAPASTAASISFVQSSKGATSRLRV